MKVDTARLPEEGADVSGEVPAETLGLDAKTAGVALGPIQCRVRVVLVTGQLLVRGTVGVDLSVACSRCAEPVRLRVEEARFECAIEVKHPDESVDLTPEIRESILLALPFYPLCRADCRGLCSRCGKNLNAGPCDCRPPSSGGWGALDGITLKRE